MATGSSNATAADAARAKAEARRKRILEASGHRMDMVSGGSGSTGDSADGAGVDNADSGRGSSRLSKIRQRRFKGGKSESSSVATLDSADGATEEKPQEAEKLSDANKPVAETAEPLKQEAPESTPPSISTEDEGASNKKYLGVAAMRRKKLAERKKQEAEQSPGTAASGGETETGTTEVANSPSPQIDLEAIKLRPTVPVPRLPIFMQIITVLMLFLAGLDVGLQSSTAVPGYHNSLVEADTVLKPLVDFGGPLGLDVGASSGAGLSTAADLLRDKLQTDSDLNVADDTDEFDGLKPAGASDTLKPKVIDPIFRVDLDELTSGPGPVMAAARVAVSAHRAITNVCLFLPYRVVSSFFTMPHVLFASPPILFLTAVAIRFVGRRILGAAVPDASAPAGDGSGGADDGGITGGGILGTITKSIKGFIANAFPISTMIFTFYGEVRMDMYVVLCGFFVGLTAPVYIKSIPQLLAANTIGSETLFTEEPPVIATPEDDEVDVPPENTIGDAIPESTAGEPMETVVEDDVKEEL